MERIAQLGKPAAQLLRSILVRPALAASIRMHEQGLARVRKMLCAGVEDVMQSNLIRATFAVLAVALSSSVANAESQLAPQEGGTWFRWTDPKLLTGGAVLTAGYAGTALWASQDNNTPNELYTVPVLGPWFVLLSLPKCSGNESPYCAFDNATRVTLATNGVMQLAGLYLIIDSIYSQHARHENKIRVVPGSAYGEAGLTVVGRF